jgi:acyl carrier protein
MSETEIYQKLTAMFREFFDDPTIVLRPETSARDIDGWDSAKMVTIILAVEDVFGFQARSHEIDRLRCVGDFVALIQAKQRPLSSS